jgi:hypothetical protein
MNNNKDDFDLWWEWAEKPVDSMLMIDAEIHEAVMALPPDERRDRAKVNEAVRDGFNEAARHQMKSPVRMRARRGSEAESFQNDAQEASSGTHHRASGGQP